MDCVQAAILCTGILRPGANPNCQPHGLCGRSKLYANACPGGFLPGSGMASPGVPDPFESRPGGGGARLAGPVSESRMPPGRSPGLGGGASLRGVVPGGPKDRRCTVSTQSRPARSNRLRRLAPMLRFVNGVSGPVPAGFRIARRRPGSPLVLSGRAKAALPGGAFPGRLPASRVVWAVGPRVVVPATGRGARNADGTVGATLPRVGSRIRRKGGTPFACAEPGRLQGRQEAPFRRRAAWVFQDPLPLTPLPYQVSFPSSTPFRGVD